MKKCENKKNIIVVIIVSNNNNYRNIVPEYLVPFVQSLADIARRIEDFTLLESLTAQKGQINFDRFLRKSLVNQYNVSLFNKWLIIIFFFLISI